MVGWMPGWPILPARPRGLFGERLLVARRTCHRLPLASRSTHVPPIPPARATARLADASPMRAIIFSAGRPRAESSPPHGATYVPPDRSRGFRTLRESLSVRARRDRRRAPRIGRRSSSSMSLCELCISALPWKSRIHENEHPVAAAAAASPARARAGGDEWGRGGAGGTPGRSLRARRRGARGARGVTAGACGRVGERRVAHATYLCRRAPRPHDEAVAAGLDDHLDGWGPSAALIQHAIGRTIHHHTATATLEAPTHTPARTRRRPPRCERHTNPSSERHLLFWRLLFLLRSAFRRCPGSDVFQTPAVSLPARLLSPLLESLLSLHSWSCTNLHKTDERAGILATRPQGFDFSSASWRAARWNLAPRRQRPCGLRTSEAAQRQRQFDRRYTSKIIQTVTYNVMEMQMECLIVNGA